MTRSKPPLTNLCMGVLFALLSLKAYSGQISYPNLVFVSLDQKNGAEFTRLFKEIVNAPNPKCWNGTSALIYVSTRPKNLTDDLVRKAVIKHDPKAIKLIGSILLSYKDDEVRGFDGLVALVDDSGPRLISITAGRTRVRSFALFNTDNVHDIEDAFCAVIPPVVRKP
jgi:hypothetical protein